MNRQFPESYDIISDQVEHTPENVSKPWYGIILHDDTVIEEITIAKKPKLVDLAVIALLIKDVPIGTPFLMNIAQIKLVSGACKMINPN